MFGAVLTTFYSLVPLNNTIGGAKVLPDDFKGTITSETFMRMGVVFAPSKLVSNGGAKEVRGLLKFIIYAPSGSGGLAFTNAATSLNSLFEKKLLANNIQTYASSLQLLGTDPKDSTLSRAEYTVPFSYYGE